MLAYTPVHHLLFGLPGDPPGPRGAGDDERQPGRRADRHRRRRRARPPRRARRRLARSRPADPRARATTRWSALPRAAQLPVRRRAATRRCRSALPVPVRARACRRRRPEEHVLRRRPSGYAWMSAHVGDMDDLATLQAFDAATTPPAGDHPACARGDRRRPASRLTAARPGPGAIRGGLPVRTVQHHHAHIASAMAENGHDGREPVIGVAFDGTGYGDDGAVWGGEVLLADYDGYERAAHLRYVVAARRRRRRAQSRAGWRCRTCMRRCRVGPAAALCRRVHADGARRARRQLATGLGCTPTSSMGRLFDAMSSLAGVCHRVAYEAEAAMRFEGLAREAIESCAAPYAFGLDGDAAGRRATRPRTGDRGGGGRRSVGRGRCRDLPRASTSPSRDWSSTLRGIPVIARARTPWPCPAASS